MASKKSVLEAHWLKTALKKSVFNHTFASCQKLGWQNWVFELVLGVVPAAFGYDVKVLILEHIAKYHISR